MSFFYVHLFETISLVNWYKLTNGKIIPSFFLPRTFLILFFFSTYFNIRCLCVQCACTKCNYTRHVNVNASHFVLSMRFPCTCTVFWSEKEKERKEEKPTATNHSADLYRVFFFANDNVMYRVCIKQNCERYTIPNYKLWFFVSFFPLREMIWFACWLTSCARSSIYTAYAWLSQLISFSLSITNNNQFWHV